MVWPMYILDCGERWQLNNSINHCTIMQLELYCQQLDKWDEIYYIKAFMSLQNRVSPGTGNPLMLQRREVASKLLANNRITGRKGE